MSYPPLPQTCKFCGICSEYYCISEKEVEKCSHKPIYEKRLATYQRRKTEVENEYKNTQELVQTLKERVNKGHGRGSITRKELELIKRNLKGAHQYFALWI